MLLLQLLSSPEEAHAALVLQAFMAAIAFLERCCESEGLEGPVAGPYLSEWLAPPLELGSVACFPAS